MDRTQGVTFGAIVLAGLLFRPGASLHRASADAAGVPNAAASVTQAATSPAGGAGPWIASCSYWAPARQIADQDSSNTAQSGGDRPSITGTLKGPTGSLDLHVTASADEEEGRCPKETNGTDAGERERWGLPARSTDDTPENTPNITSLIATVPDPVHTQMSLEFDRRIDALIHAAGDSGYVSSYYWLPWKTREHGTRTSQTAQDMEAGQDAKQEREPGLIIFKYVPNEGGENVSPSNSFYNVVYVFLVAETPTVGVDGFQLRKAFEYEEMLGGRRSFNAGNKCGLTIIGPNFTGAAASLEKGIETEIARKPPSGGVCVNGLTSTALAVSQLAKPSIDFKSFAENTAYSREQFLKLLDGSGYARKRVAIVSEDNTAFGTSITWAGQQKSEPLVIRFPRGISQLRNAYAEEPPNEAGANSQGAPPSPYLHLSLRDRNVDDSVPHFSFGQTPVSQEAVLMTIARQLGRDQVQFVVIDATDPLDELFLAQFLHRACPDARLIFPKGDLLLEREIDNVPFVGALTITPSPLMGLGSSTGVKAQRAYPDSEALAYYNAASYAFWDGDPKDLHMASYQNELDLTKDIHPPLFATAVGRDGYYPLAIISARASKEGSRILPDLLSTPSAQYLSQSPVTHVAESVGRFPVHPSLSWYVLCIFALFLSVVHGLVRMIASYKSPLTHDLVIEGNAEPDRRSMNLQIGTAMLFCMDAVLAIPLLATLRRNEFNGTSFWLSIFTLACGVLEVVLTFSKTWNYIWWKHQPHRNKNVSKIRYIDMCLRNNRYFLVNLIAWFTLLAVPALWGFLCCKEWVNGMHSHVGLYFSIRCINPASGVSPVVPMLLLLFSWYLWAIFQTRRMRFSMEDRPILPGSLGHPGERLLFVSDEDLNDCNRGRGCLYRNITCLLITREVLRRFWKKHQDALDIGLVVFYFGLFAAVTLFSPVESLDRFLWNTGPFSTPYDFLISALLFPLLVIAFCGWLRMIFIWGSLRKELLERLEHQPIRHAFSRLKGAGWMTMLSQGGLHEQWRDMARLTESLHQMMHESEHRDTLHGSADSDYYNRLEAIGIDLDRNIEKFLREPGAGSFRGMRAIEEDYARFCKVLLAGVLIPYWERVRYGTVASEGAETIPIKVHPPQTNQGPPEKAVEFHATYGPSDPLYIRVAEECLTIRYVSLIRAVLVNLRYLMLFVTASFVLAIIGLNSYPFQPRQIINWCFTGVLILMGSGIIWVFAQMHRDAILSRITKTNASELGADFYIRIFTFGAIPVLTWLAYQFPDIGSTLFKLLSPAVSVMK